MFWITDLSVFANPNKYNKTIELIDKEVKRSKEDFIQHFKNKYCNPYPPAWMLVEILPLGIVTRIFENIKSNSLKKKIAAHYELPVPVLTSWLTVITLTRNSCCHHSRVWNRIYAVTPMIAKKLSEILSAGDVILVKGSYGTKILLLIKRSAASAADLFYQIHMSRKGKPEGSFF